MIGVALCFPPREDMNELKEDEKMAVVENNEWLRGHLPGAEWVFGT